MWKAVEQTKKAVQGSSSADADYIAFIRLGLKENDGKGIITHIAKVKDINPDIPSDYDCMQKVPGLTEYYKEKGWRGLSKEYILEEIQKLTDPIPHKKGDRARSQVKFYTTTEELKNAKVLSDIKTISQLEKEKLSGSQTK